MGLFDTFKGNQYKAELEKSQAECERLKSLFTPEMQQADALQRKIEELQNRNLPQNENETCLRFLLILYQEKPMKINSTE